MKIRPVLRHTKDLLYITATVLVLFLFHAVNIFIKKEVHDILAM